MKILLLGASGQLGRALVKPLSELGELVAVCRQTHPAVDMRQPETVASLTERVQPTVVVNAAAYTHVDAAEREPHVASLVNATAPTVLAATCARLGAWLIHFSSDYVFDGSGTTPWREADPSNPLNVYGQTKVAGEHGIRACGCQHLILRTSWVYGDGKNFIRSLLNRSMTQGDAPLVVADQVGAPTSAKQLVSATAKALTSCLADPRLSGTYHVTAQGETSWHELAVRTVSLGEQLGLPLRFRAVDIAAVSSAQYPTAARRPLNSRLNCSQFVSAFGFELPDWQLGVTDYVNELAPTLIGTS